MTDAFDLQRFVGAQERIYPAALQELRAGRKRSHWMWFIFPQIRGLGSSPASSLYAIASADEARAYWQHPVLGHRLGECTQTVLALQDLSAEEIFSYPDDLKFRSSMTLFDYAVKDSDLFKTALRKYFSGEADRLTLDILSLR